MRRTAIFLAATMALLPTSSLAITKCFTDDGRTVFTDTECPAGSEPAGKITYKTPPLSGLREGERRMLHSIEAREAEDRAYKRYQYDKDARHHVGFGDRKRIKSLERRKRELQRSLKSDASFGKGWAIEQEIQGIDRQIEQIRAPKW